MPGDDLTTRSRADQVRAEIERTRAQLATSVMELRHEVAVRTDWREWVRRRPALCLTAAFAVGLYLGTRGARR